VIVDASCSNPDVTLGGVIVSDYDVLDDGFWD